jgi:hypothetical protein
VLHIRAYRDGHRPWYTSAIFVNSLGVFLPALVLSTLIPYGVIASNNLQSGVEATAKLYEVLQREASAWTPGSVVDPSQLHLTSLLVFDVAEKMWRFQTNYELFFSILAGWCGFLGISFVSVASLYLRDLKRSIKGMQGRTKTGVETFAKTYRWLVLVTIGLGTSMSTFFSLLSKLSENTDMFRSEQLLSPPIPHGLPLLSGRFCRTGQRMRSLSSFLCEFLIISPKMVWFARAELSLAFVASPSQSSVFQYRS